MNDTSEVKLHFLDYWRVIRVRWSILVIAFLLVVVTAGVTCFFLPRQYFSKVILEVKPDNNQFQIWSTETPYSRGGSDPKLQPTQFQIIQSKEILYPVATVILGGLVSSTLLDFFVRPALFWTFGRRAARRAMQHHAHEPDIDELEPHGARTAAQHV